MYPGAVSIFWISGSGNLASTWSGKMDIRWLGRLFRYDFTSFGRWLSSTISDCKCGQMIGFDTATRKANGRNVPKID
jgi:hypothetical protein